MKRILLVLMMVPMCLHAEDSPWPPQCVHLQRSPGEFTRFFCFDSLLCPEYPNNGISAGINGGRLLRFYDLASATESNSGPDDSIPPGHFLGVPPAFNTPPELNPEMYFDIRSHADYFLNADRNEWYVSVSGQIATCYHWEEGTALDTLGSQSLTINLSPRTIIFIEGRADIRGILDHENCGLVLGSSGDLRIIDDLRLWGTENGHIRADATSEICIASEKSVLIGNTPQNGRENQAEGADVVITAIITVLRGSFEIEQQNDVGDPYICGCSPDERGVATINGQIVQPQPGYLHRSNLGGTGYVSEFLLDPQMVNWTMFVDEDGEQGVPDSLIFADTPVGQTLWDTVEVTGNGPFSGALATYPFFTNAGYDYNGPTFSIPVSFTPPHAGPYFGTLSFFLSGDYHSIALRGNGVSSAPPIAPEIFPNPFNNVAALSFTLPQAAHVRAVVYDVLGRETARIADAPFTAGQHRWSVNAAAWSSGVYFLRFETLGQIETRKMMLIK